MYTPDELYKLIIYAIDNYPIDLSKIVYSASGNDPNYTVERIAEQKETEKVIRDWWNECMYEKHCSLKLISSEEYYKLLNNPWEGKSWKDIHQDSWDQTEGDDIFINTAEGNKRNGAIDIKTSEEYTTGTPDKESVQNFIHKNLQDSEKGKYNFYLCIGKTPESVICIPGEKLLNYWNRGLIIPKKWFNSDELNRYFNHRNKKELN